MLRISHPPVSPFASCHAMPDLYQRAGRSTQTGPTFGSLVLVISLVTLDIYQRLIFVDLLTRACPFRVKLPKTFLAVNLSDAFTFQEKQHNGDENVATPGPTCGAEGGEKEGLEMKTVEHAAATTTGPLDNTAETTGDAAAASESTTLTTAATTDEVETATPTNESVATVVATPKAGEIKEGQAEEAAEEGADASTPVPTPVAAAAASNMTATLETSDPKPEAAADDKL